MSEVVVEYRIDGGVTKAVRFQSHGNGTKSVSSPSEKSGLYVTISVERRCPTCGHQEETPDHPSEGGRA